MAEEHLAPILPPILGLSAPLPAGLTDAARLAERSTGVAVPDPTTGVATPAPAPEAQATAASGPGQVQRGHTGGAAQGAAQGGAGPSQEQLGQELGGIAGGAAQAAAGPTLEQPGQGRRQGGSQGLPPVQQQWDRERRASAVEGILNPLLGQSFVGFANGRCAHVRLWGVQDWLRLAGRGTECSDLWHGLWGACTC